MLETGENHNKTSDGVNRLVDSFCSDVMHALTNGTFLTIKHASLGLRLQCDRTETYNHTSAPNRTLYII